MNIRLLSVVSAAVLLTACGNKGPLVLPQKPVPVETSAPAPQPADTPAQPQPANSQTQPQPAEQPAQEPSATPPPKR